ncbi:MAG: transglycosylase domain-containing protein [Streptosporangiaceae bacterium]
MSSPEYPGPYWQDPPGGRRAGYGSGARGRGGAPGTASGRGSSARGNGGPGLRAVGTPPQDHGSSSHGAGREFPAAGDEGGAQAVRELRGRLGLPDGGGSAYAAGGRSPNGYAAPPGRPGTAGRGRAPGGPGTPRPAPDSRRAGRRWWRHWTWKKALGVLVSLGLVILVVVIAGVLYAYNHTPIPTDATEAALQQSSEVYFAGGKSQVGTFTTGIDRQMLTSSQIPALMKSAIVAAEDRHFYTEGGISITGTARAAFEDVFGSGGLQGGSTITQQFVRNYYAGIGTQQTISRKIKEIFVAIKLAHEKSKQWILTQYLNTVYFGDNAYGVGAAAQTYFSRPASKLTVSQAAMLAAMVNQPGYFNPDPSSGAPYRGLKARWSYVLGNMVRDGALSRQQAATLKFPALNPGPLDNGWTGYRGYIMEAVETELRSTYHFSQQEIDTGGLKIVTTFSRAKMNALYQTVAAEKRQMKADGRALPWYAHVGAVLEKPGSGAILAMYAGPSYTAKDCARLKCQYNMAMQSRNLVGSSFKPYVLATAVKEGMNVSDSVLNAIEPMCVPPDTMPLTLSLQSVNCPAGYFPVNIAGENMGAVSVPKAAALSSDPAFEDLVHRAGTQNTINLAKSLGVDVASTAKGGSGLQDKVGQVGMALGTASLTVEEQATTFATLADGGMYYTPHVIAQLSKAGKNIPLKVSHHRVLTPAQAADVDYALSFDTVYGTAYPNGVLNPVRPTIAKTGTTDQAQSAFFIGAIPQYSLAIGMFTNQQNELAGGQTLNVLPTINGQAGGYGGAWPTTIWQAYMQREFASLPVLQMPTPNFTGFVKWVQVKPKPKPQPRPKPSPSCGGHAFWHPCPSQSPVPHPSPSCGFGIICHTPTPTPTITGAPTPTPTPTHSFGPPGAHTTAATSLTPLSVAALALADEPPSVVLLRPAAK